MTSPLAADLQIVALLRYVDACSSGMTPHVDCPLAAALPIPPDKCVPACRDALTVLLRRGRAAVTAAGDDFDARQIRLSEATSEPDILWHTSSLLQELARAVRTHPYSPSGHRILKREVFATSALAALAHRGLDPEGLLRSGLGNRIRFGLASWLAWMDQAPDARTRLWPHYETWKGTFEVVKVPDSGVRGYLHSAMTGPGQRYIDDWLANAPFDDLLGWPRWNTWTHPHVCSPTIQYFGSGWLIDSRRRTCTAGRSPA